MTLWQLSDLSSFLDGKSSGAVRALQILEAVDGNAAGAGGELQQARLLLGIPRADAFPEVLDDLIVLGVAAVVGVLLPVVHVDICDTADQQLELALVEHIDQIRRDQLVEAGDEGGELLLDSLLDAPLCDQAATVSSNPYMSSNRKLTQCTPSCSRS